MGSCLLGLASNHDSPSLYFPSSWDYRHGHHAQPFLIVLGAQKTWNKSGKMGLWIWMLSWQKLCVVIYEPLKYAEFMLDHEVFSKSLPWMSLGNTESNHMSVPSEIYRYKKVKKGWLHWTMESGNCIPVVRSCFIPLSLFNHSLKKLLTVYRFCIRCCSGFQQNRACFLSYCYL
jgi:hypothetical protein